MPAGTIEIVIDKGEDWTTQLIWTDHYDNPVPVIHPCRMDIRGNGATLVSLETSEGADEDEEVDGSIPKISLSTTTGLIQLHLPREVTANFPPGMYSGDFIATVENTDGGRNQVQRLFFARITVNNSITLL